METRTERTRIALGRDPAPLPVPAEIDARLVVHRQRRDPVNLAAIRNPTVVLAPGCLLCEPKQVRAGDVVMMADFTPAHVREEALGGIGVDLMLAAQAVGFVMIDPVQGVPAVTLGPRAGGIRVQGCSLRHLPTNEAQSLNLAAEYTGNCLAAFAALADDDHHLALAALVLAKPAIPAVLSAIGGFDMAAKKSAIDFRFLSLAADQRLPDIRSHRFTNFVRQDEGSFVLRPEITAERQHRLSLNLVREDRDRHQVGAQRHLVEREQRAARDREILAAGFAAPARSAARAPRHVDRRAATVRAEGVAVIAGPA